jgi:NAD(P)-dependent dehydrogenase (short-subunit alcohol dehydrogenase family)
MLATSKTCPAGTVRIMNLTSSGHWRAPKGGINFADLNNKDGAPWSRYGQSKLADILHAKTLNRLYGPASDSAKNGKGEIWTAAVHPGLVESQLADRAGENFNYLSKFLRLMRQYIDSDRGSYTSLFCVASKDMKKEQSGKYFERVAKSGTWWESKYAKDPHLAEKLEKWTREQMDKEGWVKNV